MKEKESDKAHRIAISKHFPVSYYGVSMAPSGPRTIAQVCTLEYCHPANGNKGPKQDNPERKHGLRGEGCNGGGKGDLWNANWASSPHWSGERVPIVALNRSSDGMRCEEIVCLVTNTSLVHWKHTVAAICGPIKHTQHFVGVKCRFVIDWVCLGESLQVYMLWLVHPFRQFIPLVLERQWDPIVPPSSSSLHLSVQLKRPINNRAPLPCLPPPLLCFWSEEEWDRGSTVALTHPTVQHCPFAKRGGCWSFQISTGLFWFMELLRGTKPNDNIHSFQYLHFHFNPDLRGPRCPTSVQIDPLPLGWVDSVHQTFTSNLKSFASHANCIQKTLQPWSVASCPIHLVMPQTTESLLIMFSEIYPLKGDRCECWRLFPCSVDGSFKTSLNCYSRKGPNCSLQITL